MRLERKRSANGATRTCNSRFLFRFFAWIPTSILQDNMPESIIVVKGVLETSGPKGPKGAKGGQRGPSAPKGAKGAVRVSPEPANGQFFLTDAVVVSRCIPVSPAMLNEKHHPHHPTSINHHLTHPRRPRRLRARLHRALGVRRLLCVAAPGQESL